MPIRSRQQIAFGLDLAGYSTNGSAFARAVKEVGVTQSKVTVFRGHCFSVSVEGIANLEAVAARERTLIQQCLELGTLDVDVPIHLQDLPSPGHAKFVWELTKRPVDWAFGAMPPLAQLIGSYVARFSNVIRPLIANLDERLFETYPAASLELMGLSSEKYKGEAFYSVTDAVWTAQATKDEVASNRNATFASMLNRLGWSAESSTVLTHDEFDATLCSLTGLADSSSRLERESLRAQIRQRLVASHPATSHHQLRDEPPKGYRLLSKIPVDVHLSWVTITKHGDTLDALKS